MRDESIFTEDGGHACSQMLILMPRSEAYTKLTQPNKTLPEQGQK